MERARKGEAALQARFQDQQAEQQDIEEQHGTLQEEAQGLSKKLKKVQNYEIFLKKKVQNYGIFWNFFDFSKKFLEFFLI